MRPIVEYMNYREYLRDYYEERKAGSPHFSYRLFSELAGFRAPNLLKLVIEGQRSLTKQSVLKFVKAIRLKKREAEYFENLVFFNQSETLEEKNLYLQRLMKVRGGADPKRIEQSEYEYYSAWWHPVVRELVVAVDFQDDYRRLGSMVVPAIAAAEAQKSVELLLRLGFVRKEDDGRFVQASTTLTTGPRVRSVAVANYHREMMKLAAESIERFDADTRSVTSLTLGVSEQTRAILVEKVRQFRKELLAIAEAETNPQRVVQLNFQVFPLTKTFGQKEETQ
jgi:uncharacterized protein (TIGR02147 family)